MINEQGGVLGTQDAALRAGFAGKNEAGVAAYRRLVSEKRPSRCSASSIAAVNIAVNEVAKEMGVPTMRCRPSASDVTAKHYDIAFRTHAVDPPRAATWLGWIKKKGFKRVSLIAETTDYGIGLAKETEAQNKAKNLGLEIQTIMFDRTDDRSHCRSCCRSRRSSRTRSINIGVGQPLDLMITRRRPSACCRHRRW